MYEVNVGARELVSEQLLSQISSRLGSALYFAVRLPANPSCDSFTVKIAKRMTDRYVNAFTKSRLPIR